MNASRRDGLATEVNAAILGKIMVSESIVCRSSYSSSIAFQKRPEMPAMERIYRQTVLCNKELACSGHGKASLLNIDAYCVHPSITQFQ